MYNESYEITSYKTDVNKNINYRLLLVTVLHISFAKTTTTEYVNYVT